jgi:ATP-dependent Clp protease protease subunit
MNNELEKPKDMLDYGEYLVKYGNEKMRRFFLQGPITDIALSVTTHTLGYIAALSEDPIMVDLFTYGGDINCGLAIYDLVKRIGKKVPIDIMATGACMSMGVIILQAARHRYATPHAHFMLHQLRGTNEGDLGEQRDRYKHMEHLQSTLNNVLASRTGKTARQIDKLIDRKDYYISAEDALKINLIDKIVEE